MKTSQGLAGLQEGFQRRLLGVGRVGGRQLSGPEGEVGIAQHQLLKGVLVPAPRARDELTVVQWPALHRRLLYTPDPAAVPILKQVQRMGAGPG